MEIKQTDRHEWFNRGKILASVGKLESAIACYDKAIAIKPNYYEAWCEKGEVLEQLGKIEEADACFNKALGVFSNSLEESLEDDVLLAIPATDEASSLYNKACFHALQNNVAQAIDNLLEAIQIQPTKYCYMASQDSDFTPIRSHKEFKSLNSLFNRILVP
ncbi:MAG: tetratricopeptide repeat protein [Xenococcaceae cyanobacterium MO_207.B15]|nr:tetratricopeptide repeat protein [Xenococcaceae cyanobacterium MO_207.B15]MDJ0742102.1 tetratricopeptide repeat protein [Xenococcaceae cyanobacterium MO_167.B27]